MAGKHAFGRSCHLLLRVRRYPHFRYRGPLFLAIDFTRFAGLAEFESIGHGMRHRILVFFRRLFWGGVETYPSVGVSAPLFRGLDGQYTANDLLYNQKIVHASNFWHPLSERQLLLPLLPLFSFVRAKRSKGM